MSMHILSEQTFHNFNDRIYGTPSQKSPLNMYADMTVTGRLEIKLQ